MQSVQHKSYLMTLIVSAAVVFVAVAGFNFFMDPWGLFGVPRISGINERKPEAGDYVRLSKPYQVTRMSPKLLVLGNSRAELGLNPNTFCSGKFQGQSFVLAVPGSSVFLQYRFMQHAIANEKPEMVLMALDATDFFTLRDADAVPDSEPAAVEWERRLLVRRDGRTNKKRWTAILTDYADGLMSLAATVDSIRTLVKQNARGQQNRTEAGFHDADNYYRQIVTAEGQGVLFQQKMNELRSRYSDRGWQLQSRNGDVKNAWESLDKVIELVLREDIELVFIINPLHARYLELLHETGLWRLVEEWRRQLVTTLSQRGAGIRLIDFTGYDAHSMEEPAPESGRRVIPEWFWEPSHYTQALGNLMLSRALPMNCQPMPGGAVEYGVELTAENLDAVNQRIRTERRTYLGPAQSSSAALRH